MRMAFAVGLVFLAGISSSGKAHVTMGADGMRLALWAPRPEPALDFTILQTQSAADDIWAPLKFLLGSWDGTSKGQPGNGTAKREYRLVLRDRFIETRTVATYPPQPQNPEGETHEDVGYISYDRSRKTFVFRQFHVEGFVNTYVAGPVTATETVFTSDAIENIGPGWRARETYRSLTGDEWSEVFELAEPARDFTVYSETRLRRRR